MLRTLARDGAKRIYTSEDPRPWRIFLANISKIKTRDICAKDPRHGRGSSDIYPRRRPSLANLLSEYIQNRTESMRVKKIRRGRGQAECVLRKSARDAGFLSEYIRKPDEKHVC